MEYLSAGQRADISVILARLSGFVNYHVTYSPPPRYYTTCVGEFSMPDTELYAAEVPFVPPLFNSWGVATLLFLLCQEGRPDGWMFLARTEDERWVELVVPDC